MVAVTASAWMPAAGAALRRLLFKVGLPLAHAGKAVHPRAVGESALRGGNVLGLAGPGFLWRVLERATVGERQFPRQVGNAVHGVQMGRRFLVRLSARQESDARNRGRNARLEEPHGLFRDLLDAGALRALFARNYH